MPVPRQNVQNANLERALKALTAQMGGEVSDLPEVKARNQAERERDPAED